MVAAEHEDRARGRELALLTACHLESYPEAERADARVLLWDDPPDGEGSELPTLLASEGARAFAASLLDALLADPAALDALIEDVSERWRVDRMDRVDRNVVRLAAIELRRGEETPRAVVLAEAVRLASRYGSDRSAPFVNGLVESLARVLRPDAPASESA